MFERQNGREQRDGEYWFKSILTIEYVFEATSSQSTQASLSRYLFRILGYIIVMPDTLCLDVLILNLLI